ncbi:hypothetical protein FQR65_LT02119 [Abscondita terminalis]|nr:hypothetical protein FQR65_LT02119 [Abscondita terminalis]
MIGAVRRRSGLLKVAYGRSGMFEAAEEGSGKFGTARGGQTVWGTGGKPLNFGTNVERPNVPQGYTAFQCDEVGID